MLLHTYSLPAHISAFFYPSPFLRNFQYSHNIIVGAATSTARPLDVSSAISFVLSAQCCSTQIPDNPNHIVPSGSSYFCKAEIAPLPYIVCALNHSTLLPFAVSLNFAPRTPAAPLHMSIRCRKMSK